MCSGMSFYSGAKSSQKKELRLYLIPFNMSSAHECLKKFFYFFTSFLLTCNTPKMAMKMCSASFETTIMFLKHTHTRAPIHTSRHGIIMKRSSFQADKNINGSCGDLQWQASCDNVSCWIEYQWRCQHPRRILEHRRKQSWNWKQWFKLLNPSCQIMHLILNSFFFQSQ